MSSEYLPQVEKVSKRWNDLVINLTNEQLHQKPNPDTWSVAEIVEHLTLVTNSFQATFEAIHSNTLKVPFTGKIGFLVKTFGNLLLKSVHPKTTKKTKTFPVWEPKMNQKNDDVLQAFNASQQFLQTSIVKFEQAGKLQTVISSPANKYIVYTLERALQIIISHQNRHFLQAKSVISTIK